MIWHVNECYNRELDEKLLKYAAKRIKRDRIIFWFKMVMLILIAVAGLALGFVAQVQLYALIAHALCIFAAYVGIGK